MPKKKAKEKTTKQMTFTAQSCIIEALERRAHSAGSTPSNILETLVRIHILRDENYHSLMAKEAYLKMQEHIYLRDQAQQQAEMDKEAAADKARAPIKVQNVAETEIELVLHTG